MEEMRVLARKRIDTEPEPGDSSAFGRRVVSCADTGPQVLTRLDGEPGEPVPDGCTGATGAVPAVGAALVAAAAAMLLWWQPVGEQVTPRAVERSRSLPQPSVGANADIVPAWRAAVGRVIDRAQEQVRSSWQWLQPDATEVTPEPQQRDEAAGEPATRPATEPFRSSKSREIWPSRSDN